MISACLDGLRGSLAFNVAPRTWFRVGGPADLLFHPADTEDLQHFLDRYPPSRPLHWIGAASNLLIRDQGLRGAVIRLGKNFSTISLLESAVIRVQAAALAPTVAKFCLQRGIGGFEFLSGIPGSIGGCVAMNAGAFNQQISNHLLEIELIDRSGQIRVIDAQTVHFDYRSAALPADSYVLSAVLKGYLETRETIQNNTQIFTEKRRRRQPLGSQTGGSTFLNPGGQNKAWELIDRAGCRGLKHAEAQVSAKHPNFLINLGRATAHDIETLGETVRLRVLQASGALLEWEIRRVGTRIEPN